MATTVKITTIGNSVGIVLPKEVLAKLKVEKGDTLYITESPEGGWGINGHANTGADIAAAARAELAEIAKAKEAAE